MRPIAALAAFLLAGCALTPDRVAQLSDYDVCRYSLAHMHPESRGVAWAEARRRGIECHRYAASIEAAERQLLRDTAEAVSKSAEASRATQPIYCTSTASPATGTVRTICQ